MASFFKLMKYHPMTFRLLQLRNILFRIIYLLDFQLILLPLTYLQKQLLYGHNKKLKGVLNDDMGACKMPLPHLTLKKGLLLITSHFKNILKYPN